MNLLFSSADLARIMAATDAETPLPNGENGRTEKCGLLLAGPGQEVRCEEVANVSAAPLDSFEIDPAALLRAHRRQREPGGPVLLGFYHTHPSGDAYPSIRDAHGAAPDGRLWLIATARRATLWQAVAGGQVHGRFDPVRFDVAAGNRVDKDRAEVHMASLGEASAVYLGEPPF